MTEVLRQHAEQQFADELDALAKVDKKARPPNWKLSPWAVATYLLGGKAGKKEILIATDVAARGIDVNDVTHVINHTVPDDPDTYLHRAGRTGRAGKTGIAVTFVDWADMHKWSLINRGLDFGQPEPVETTPRRRTCSPTSTSPRARRVG